MKTYLNNSEFPDMRDCNVLRQHKQTFETFRHCWVHTDFHSEWLFHWFPFWSLNVYCNAFMTHLICNFLSRTLTKFSNPSSSKADPGWLMTAGLLITMCCDLYWCIIQWKPSGHAVIASALTQRRRLKSLFALPQMQLVLPGLSVYEHLYCCDLLSYWMLVERVHQRINLQP